MQELQFGSKSRHIWPVWLSYGKMSELRRKVLKCILAGDCPMDVAKRFDVARSTVFKIKKAYEETENVKVHPPPPPTPRPDGPRSVRTMTAEVCMLIGTQPSTSFILSACQRANDVAVIISNQHI